jgi:hypothetical protein
MLAREFGEDLFEKKKKAENRGKEACVAVTRGVNGSEKSN